MVKLRYDEIGPADSGLAGVKVPVLDTGGAVLNVRAFGADPGADPGDNVTAINSTLAQVGVHGRALISPGAYEVDGSLVLNEIEGAYFEGWGAGLTQLTNETRSIVMNGCVNVTLAGFTLNGVGSDYADSSGRQATGIYMVDCVGCTVEHCVLTDMSFAGVQYRTCSDITIQWCRISGPAGELEADNNYCFGVYGELGGSSNIRIIGNTIGGTAQGIATGSNQTGLLIQLNTIRNIVGQHGIYLAACDDTDISHNWIYTTALDGIKCQMSSSADAGRGRNLSITHNTIVGSGSSWGINVGRTAGDEWWTNLVVAFNLVDGSLGGGITARYVRGGRVEHNTINAPVGYGVFLQQYEGSEGSNRISASGDAPLYLSTTEGGRIDAKETYIEDPVTDAGASNPQAVFATAPAGGGTVRVEGVRVVLGDGLATRAVLSGSAVTLELQSNDFPTSLLVQAGGPVALDDGNAFGGYVSNPTAGAGRAGRDFFGSAAPVSGDYLARDRVWNTGQTVGSPALWMCRVSGSPGTWVPIGQKGVVPGVGSAPSFVGQIAVTSGNAYIATGVGSSADWKQIT